MCRKLWKCSTKIRRFFKCFSPIETLPAFSLGLHHQSPGSHHSPTALALSYISYIICSNILKYSLFFWVTVLQKQSKALNGVTVVILHSSPRLPNALDSATVIFLAAMMMWKHSKDRYLQLAWPPINKFFLCCPMNSVKKIDNPITFWRKIAIFVT